MRPGASELARPKQHFAALEGGADAGQQLGIAHRMHQRAPRANLRACDTLHHRVGPAHVALGRDGDHRLLHRVEHCGQFLAAAFELSKVLAEALGGLVQRGFHRGELVFAGLAEPRAQVAVGDAAGKGDHARSRADMRLATQAARGIATARAMSPDHRASRPMPCSVFPAVCSTMLWKTNSIITVWKTSRRTKSPSSLSEDFMRQFRAYSPLGSSNR